MAVVTIEKFDLPCLWLTTKKEHPSRMLFFDFLFFLAGLFLVHAHGIIEIGGHEYGQQKDTEHFDPAAA
ncbi:MAG: hypothetical protein IJF73_05435 [Clostridia bacterium]|nr:hypothetical protein [Clostridia bacterium]